MAMEMTKRRRNPEGIADPVATATYLYRLRRLTSDTFSLSIVRSGLE